MHYVKITLNKYQGAVFTGFIAAHLTKGLGGWSEETNITMNETMKQMMNNLNQQEVKIWEAMLGICKFIPWDFRNVPTKAHS